MELNGILTIADKIQWNIPFINLKDFKDISLSDAYMKQIFINKKITPDQLYFNIIQVLSKDFSENFQIMDFCLYNQNLGNKIIWDIGNTFLLNKICNILLEEYQSLTVFPFENPYIECIFNSILNDSKKYGFPYNYYPYYRFINNILINRKDKTVKQLLLVDSVIISFWQNFVNLFYNFEKNGMVTNGMMYDNITFIALFIIHYPSKNWTGFIEWLLVNKCWGKVNRIYLKIREIFSGYFFLENVWKLLNKINFDSGKIWHITDGIYSKKIHVTGIETFEMEFLKNGVLCFPKHNSTKKIASSLKMPFSLLII